MLDSESDVSSKTIQAVKIHIADIVHSQFQLVHRWCPSLSFHSKDCHQFHMLELLLSQCYLVSACVSVCIIVLL